YRANPSFRSLVATMSLDLPFDDRLFARLYGGGAKYLGTNLPNDETPSEWRAGGELHCMIGAEIVELDGTWFARSPSAAERMLRDLFKRSNGANHGSSKPPDGTFLRRRRRPFSVELAYEVLARRRYEHIGTDRTATFRSTDG